MIINAYIYEQENENNIALSIAHLALTFYEIYKGLNDIGATRLLSKSNLPCSIGLGNTFSAVNNFVHSNQLSEDCTKSHQSALSAWSPTRFWT